MEVVPLFASALVQVREVRCGARRGGDGGDERSSEPCVAIPLRGCYALDRCRRTVIADPNTAVFFDAVAPYRVAHPADDGDVSFVVGWSADELPAPPPTHVALDPAAQLRIRRFRRALLDGRVETLAAEETAIGLLADLLRTQVPELNLRRTTAVERTKAFFGERFREKLTLGDAARAAGISAFGLTRAFRAATGMTLHRYLTALRHAAALDALAAGAPDLTRLALDTGFAHHSHLTKTFARAFGASPSAVRAELSRPGEGPC
jgi:AraC-like DNA-binding protein